MYDSLNGSDDVIDSLLFDRIEIHFYLRDVKQSALRFRPENHDGQLSGTDERFASVEYRLPKAIDRIRQNAIVALLGFRESVVEHELWHSSAVRSKHFPSRRPEKESFFLGAAR